MSGWITRMLLHVLHHFMVRGKYSNSSLWSNTLAISWLKMRFGSFCRKTRAFVTPKTLLVKLLNMYEINRWKTSVCAEWHNGSIWCDFHHLVIYLQISICLGWNWWQISAIKGPNMLDNFPIIKNIWYYSSLLGIIRLTITKRSQINWSGNGFQHLAIYTKQLKKPRIMFDHLQPNPLICIFNNINYKRVLEDALVGGSAWICQE
jgi:hypothetical protein